VRKVMLRQVASQFSWGTDKALTSAIWNA